MVVGENKKTGVENLSFDSGLVRVDISLCYVFTWVRIPPDGCGFIQKRHAVTALFWPSEREKSPEFRAFFGVVSFLTSKDGAPGGTRTPDLLVRSQTLYPAELLAHGLFSNSLIIISAKRKNVKRFLQVFEILLKRSRRGKGRERFPGFRPAAGFLPPCLSQPLKCSGDGCCG